MNSTTPLLKFLRSQPFAVYIAFFSAISLTPNMYYVYHLLCVYDEPYRKIFSALIACVMTGAVLYYTLRKNYQYAKYFAYFEMTVSAFYYCYTIGWDWKLIPAFGFVYMLPWSVKGYAKEIDHYIEEQEQPAKEDRELTSRLIEQEEKISELTENLNYVSSGASHYEKGYNLVHAEAERLQEIIQRIKREHEPLKEEGELTYKPDGENESVTHIDRIVNANLYVKHSSPGDVVPAIKEAPASNDSDEVFHDLAKRAEGEGDIYSGFRRGSQKREDRGDFWQDTPKIE